MQLKQLLYLKTVGKTKSIRKASAELFVSQQAISQALLNMEAEYNVQLLNRNVHGVSLTDIGKHTVAEAEKILQLSTALDDYLRECSKRQLEGTLHVAAIRTFNDFILPNTKITFIKNYPKVKLTVTTMHTKQIVDMLAEQQADLGFFGIPYVDGTALLDLPPNLLFVPLITYNYGVCVGKDSPLNNLHTVSIKSILKYPIVFLGDHLDGGIENYMPYTLLKKYGDVEVIIADSAKYYQEIINNNLGIGLVTGEKFDEIDKAKSNIIPLRDNIYTNLGYLIREDCANTLLVEKFVSFLPSNIASYL